MKLFFSSTSKYRTQITSSYAGLGVLRAHKKEQMYENRLKTFLMNTQSLNVPWSAVNDRREFLKQLLQVASETLVIMACIYMRGQVDSVVLLMII